MKRTRFHSTEQLVLVTQMRVSRVSQAGRLGNVRTANECVEALLRRRPPRIVGRRVLFVLGVRLKDALANRVRRAVDNGAEQCETSSLALDRV
jgi:hypothetical protein